MHPPLLRLVPSAYRPSLLVPAQCSGRLTCAQKTVLALPSTMFMARSSPPVCVTPSATRYSVMTVSTPVLLKPAGQPAVSCKMGMSDKLCCLPEITEGS
jgi:hypothetical protein